MSTYNKLDVMYLSAVSMSLTNDKIFGMFRSHPGFIGATGVPDDHYANQCRKEMGTSSLWNELISSFSKIDSVGSPHQPFHTGVAWDTHINAHSVFLMDKYLGSVSGSVVEFGGSYGNLQYQLLSHYPQISSYTQVELPSVCKLNEKAMTQISCSFSVNYTTGSTTPISSSLFISQYAITEQVQGPASIKALNEITDHDWSYYDLYIKPANAVFLRLNSPLDIMRDNYIKRLHLDGFTILYYQLENKLRKYNHIIIAKK